MTPRALVVAIALVAVPIIPLSVTWMRLIGTARSDAPASMFRIRTEAVLTSASFALLLIGLIWNPAIGFDYSLRRFATIYSNLVLMVLVAIIAAFGSRHYRLPLMVSSLLVALEWAYLAVVSSIV